MGEWFGQFLNIVVSPHANAVGIALILFLLGCIIAILRLHTKKTNQLHRDSRESLGRLKVIEEYIAAIQYEVRNLEKQGAEVVEKIDKSTSVLARQNAETSERIGALHDRPASEMARPDLGVSEQDNHFEFVDVCFGTNRLPTQYEDGSEVRVLGFGSERSDKLHLGVAQVTIPKLHRSGRIERPLHFAAFGYTLYRGKESPERHFIKSTCKLLNDEEFATLVNERFGDDSFVFVHGFNVSFDAALFRTAQLAFDTGIRGAPYMFSWPSAGSMLGYVHDLKTSRASARALAEFLILLHRATGWGNVNIIAHSMGNAVVLDALVLVLNALDPDPKRHNEHDIDLGEIVFAAPDVPSDEFVEKVKGIIPWTRGATLYASSGDKALSASESASLALVPAGVPGPNGLVIVDGLDSIDATLANTNFLSLNHSGFAEHSELVDDIKILLRSARHRPPDARSVKFRPELDANSETYWRYLPE